MTEPDDRLPIHVIVPPAPARHGPPWWRTKGFVLSLGVYLTFTLIALLASFANDWSRTSLGVAGLTLDCLGIVLVALPFVSRSWLRVLRDRSIRSVEAEVDAYECDVQRTEGAYESIERQKREGIRQPRADFPDLDERNAQIEWLYELRTTWRRRLVVPDEEAASYILLGTALMVTGFVFQAASYWVR